MTWLHVSGVYHGDLDCEGTLRVTINVCSLCTEGLHPSYECSWKRQQVQWRWLRDQEKKMRRKGLEQLWVRRKWRGYDAVLGAKKGFKRGRPDSLVLNSSKRSRLYNVFSIWRGDTNNKGLKFWYWKTLWKIKARMGKDYILWNSLILKSIRVI